MRTPIQALVATAVVALAACSNSYPQPAHDPINKDPKPQQAINEPKPQQPTFGSGGSQTPFNDPSVQQPSFGQPSSPEAISQHDSTKPFYGPGLKEPEEREQALDKAKTTPLASDAEVLSFVMALNDGEVQMGELAKKNAENAEVKQFAGMMVQHHTQGMAKVRSLQGKTKIELKDNELTQKAKNDASTNITTLRDKKGKEFDRFYIDSQVRMHKDGLDALDNRVIPGITNGEVKTAVNTMRTQVAEHLAKAESIQKKLDPTLAKAHEDADDKDSKDSKAKKPAKKENADDRK